MPLARNRESNAEKLNAYTVGSKNRFFNNRLQVNASGYLYNYNDFHAMHSQVIAPDTGLPDDGAQTQADAVMYGADIQTTAILSGKDTLNLSVSYLNTEFKDLVFDWYSEELEDTDWTGKEMTFSPNWTISGNYKHIFDLPDGSTVSARIEARYQTSFITSIIEEVGGVDYTGFRYQEAHVMADFSAAYSNPDGKWTLTGYVKNITNYAEKRSLIQQTLNISAPRTYGAVLSARF
jgi:iron complex outermembrane receptor protein